MILASFFDPNGNGFDITDVGAITVVVIFATPIVMWINRKVAIRRAHEIREIVREEITMATQPIQPGYRNGGDSLADVSALTRKIAQHVGVPLD